MNWDWVWADRHRDLQLFDKKGPEKFARQLFSQLGSVDSFLEKPG